MLPLGLPHKKNGNFLNIIFHMSTNISFFHSDADCARVRAKQWQQCVFASSSVSFEHINRMLLLKPECVIAFRCPIQCIKRSGATQTMHTHCTESENVQNASEYIHRILSFESCFWIIIMTARDALHYALFFK